MNPKNEMNETSEMNETNKRSEVDRGGKMTICLCDRQINTEISGD